MAVACPFLWLAVVASLPPLALIAVMGSTWTIEHYFWVDLAVMPAIALLLAAIGAGRARRRERRARRAARSAAWADSPTPST